MADAEAVFRDSDILRALRERSDANRGECAGLALLESVLGWGEEPGSSLTVCALWSQERAEDRRQVLPEASRAGDRRLRRAAADPGYDEERPAKGEAARCTFPASLCALEALGHHPHDMLW